MKINDYFCSFAQCVFLDSYNINYQKDFFKQLSDQLKQNFHEKTDRIPLSLHIVWSNRKEIEEFKPDDLSVLKHNAYVLKNWNLNLWMLNAEYLGATQKEVIKMGFVLRSFSEVLPQELTKLVQDFAKKKFFAIASDITRPFILAKEGGVYADMDYKIFQDNSYMHKLVDSYWAIDNNEHRLISNYMMGAAPGHPITTHATQVIQNLFKGERAEWFSDKTFDMKHLTCNQATIMGSGPGVITMSYYFHNNKNGNVDLVLPISFAAEKEEKYAQSMAITVDDVETIVPPLGIHYNKIGWSNSCHKMSQAKIYFDYSSFKDQEYKVKLSYHDNYFGFDDDGIEIQARKLNNYPPKDLEGFAWREVRYDDTMLNKPKIFWVASFGYGGIEPDLSLLSALSEKYLVKYLTADRYKYEVLKTGAFFESKPFGSAFLDQTVEWKLDYYLFGVSNIPDLSSREFYIREAKDFDMIVYEYSSAYLLQDVALYLNKPALCTYHGVYPATVESIRKWLEIGTSYQNYSYENTKVLSRAYDITNKINKYDLKSDAYMPHLPFSSDPLNFYSTELGGSTLHYNLRYFPEELIKEILPNNLNLYFSKRKDFLELNTSSSDINTEQPIIFVTLGTAFNNNLELYQNLITVANLYSQFKWIIHCGYSGNMKHHISSAIEKLPLHVELVEYIEQMDAMLAKSYFIIHQAGGGIFYKSVFFKVPSLAIPLSSDHFYIAHIMETKSLGCMASSYSPENIQKSLDYCLKHYIQIKQSIQKIDFDTDLDVDKVLTVFDSLIKQDQSLYFTAHAIRKAGYAILGKDLSLMNNNELRQYINKFTVEVLFKDNGILEVEDLSNQDLYEVIIKRAESYFVTELVTKFFNLDYYKHKYDRDYTCESIKNTINIGLFIKAYNATLCDNQSVESASIKNKICQPEKLDYQEQVNAVCEIVQNEVNKQVSSIHTLRYPITKSLSDHLKEVYYKKMAFKNDVIKNEESYYSKVLSFFGYPSEEQTGLLKEWEFVKSLGDFPIWYSTEHYIMNFMKQKTLIEEYVRLTDGSVSSLADTHQDEHNYLSLSYVEDILPGMTLDDDYVV